jgi:hypothetical protein
LISFHSTLALLNEVSSKDDEAYFTTHHSLFTIDFLCI